ncbi:glycosyltransferase [Pedobacter sp. MC2016-24]|uniref:glycosyltransferase family 2 protein n=1 Tax=Pedobacter sp. MC2016-24 TaxID=2780090 RepID=UPI001881CCEA|nr:glycosyltransferase [Pedobacter sp. MC2016-24]MBE9598803.1 glycosyltransferase [Pedobacter sp. MC2016-24]
MPKVSVIIPNYNHADYLVQRIESVLNQSYQDFEVIILDDCSTDNSSQVINPYSQHPKVSEIIYNKKNSGSTFKQWEKGIALAKGEFIWIAESDDWCESNLLAELVFGLEKDPKCTFSYCQSYCIQNTNEISWQSQHPLLSEVIEGDIFIREYMLLNNSVFNASMVLWKKEQFKNISKEFLDYKFCGDWLFWIELSRLGKVHVSGKLLNYFRKHDQDVSGKATKTGLDLIENLKVLQILYRENLITDLEYIKAYKSQFRIYWKQKSNLDFKVAADIKLLFKTSPKVNYYKTLSSTIWQISKGK